MTAPSTTWNVQPHGPLKAVAQNILTVVGDIHMPLVEFPRRMTVVRLSNRDLVIFSAIALDEPQMAVLENFGRPAWLIVPSNRHRLDAPAWKARYPAMRVITPQGARALVEEVVPVDATSANFGDSTVHFLDTPGTKGNDAALEVQGSDGLTLVVNEIIGNIHGAHGFKGWLLGIMGFAGDHAHVPAPIKLEIKGHRSELAAQFRRWAEAPNLNRIIVSHGEIIDDDPAGVLRHLAASLD